jgi:8-oxo-dGTP pyrophosphatase MutT (NUDIX family)
MNENNTWQTIESESILSTYHVSINKDKVQLLDGAVIDDFYTVTIPDAALVVALTNDGKVLLKSEYRYACKEEVIECPAGMVNLGEDPADTARRELLEETGYVSDDWTYLGPTWESTSKLTNTMHLFLAKDCRKVGSQQLDENEHIDVMCIPFIEAINWVMQGKINANSTTHALLKVERGMTEYTIY